MKSKAIIILLGILVFLLGGIAGAVTHSLYQEYLKVKFFEASSQSIDIVGGLAKELNLDAAQTRSLRAIFEDSRKRSIALSQKMWPKYQALNKEAEPEYESIRKDAEQAIKDILNEDQKILYEEFLKNIQIPPMPGPPGT